MKARALFTYTLLISVVLNGFTVLPARAASDAASASTATQLTISHGWVRWLPNGLPKAGYLTLTNHGEQSVDLLSASSPDFGMVMLHQTISNGSTERMVKVDKLTIPAHGQTEISPGNYHLMLISATHSITPGANVTVVFKFSNGKTLTAVLPVRSAQGQ